jgi:TusA-related sulfurtransferase
MATGGAEVELDCRRQPCPMPVLALAKAVADLEVGGVVAVLSDDPASAVDIPAWCRMKGQEYVGADVAGDGTPRFRVRRVR